MEYKVGDKVVVIDGEKSYVVEITNRYKLYANGYAYDGIRLFDKENIEFLQSNIECKIESGPCTCGPKVEEAIKKEEIGERGFKIGDNVLVKTFNGDKIKAIIEKEIEHYGEEWFKVRDKNKENCFYVVRYEDMKKIEEIKEEKYLKTWEAIKALEEGEKVRKHWWDKENYIELKGEVMICNNVNNDNDKYFDLKHIKEKEEWEIYEEPKKEIPKELEGLKYILGSINNMDCGDKYCDKCPLGMDKCNMLDEIFFDMKEKYKF